MYVQEKNLHIEKQVTMILCMSYMYSLEICFWLNYQLQVNYYI